MNQLFLVYYGTLSTAYFTSIKNALLLLFPVTGGIMRVSVDSSISCNWSSVTNGNTTSTNVKGRAM